MATTWVGKTVLITGASRGIGRACAERFAEQGANLVLASRSHEGLTATQNSLPKGNRVLIVPTDVTDPFQIKNLFQKVKEEFGQLDVLINNAGCMVNTREVTDDGLEKNFATSQVLGTHYDFKTIN